MTRKHGSNGGYRLAAAALGALSLLGAREAHAQWGNGGQQNAQMVLEWQGNVDRDTRIDIGQRGVSVYGGQSNESRGRIVSRGRLPNANGTLYVQRVSGRGEVDVIQQPVNGDGIVRITDPQGGAGYYDVRVYWQPNGGYSSYPSSTYPNNGYPNGGYGNGGYDRGDDRGGYGRGGYDRDDRGYERGRGRGDVARDRNGNVVYDRNGQPVYERRGNQTLLRDRNGNVVFDRNGHAVYERNGNGNGRRGNDDGDRDDRGRRGY